MTKLRRILRNNVITGAAGLSILVALFWLTRILLSGRRPSLFSMDVYLYYIPIYETVYGFGLGGILPTWNPYQLCGLPALASLQAGFFYPGHVLYLLLPEQIAFALSGLLHLCFVAVATALFARRAGFAAIPALAVAVAVTLRGRYPVMVFWPNRMEAAAWLPLGGLAVLWIARGGGGRSMALLAVCLGLSLLAGNPQASVYLVYSWAALLVIFLLAERRSLVAWPGAVGQFGFALLLGGLLAAVQLLPGFELAREGTRTTGALSHAQMFPLGWTYGSLAEALPSALRANFPVLPLSLGGVALVLLPASLLTRRFRALALGSLAVATIVVVFAMGPVTRIFDWLLELPALSWFRVPTRSLFMMDFFVGLALGAAWQVVAGDTRHGAHEGYERYDRARRLAVVLSCLIAGGGVVALTWQESGWTPSLFAIAAAVVVGVSLVPCRRGAGGGRLRLAASGLLVGLLTIELFTAKPNLNQLFATPATAADYKKERPIYATVSGASERVWIRSVGRFPALAPNLASHFRMRSVGGYEPLNLRRQAEYFTYLMHGRLPDPLHQPYSGRLRGLTQPKALAERGRLLDLAAVRWFMVSKTSASQGVLAQYIKKRGLVRRDAPDQKFVLLENPDALPRTYVVYDVQPAPPPLELMKILSQRSFDPLKTSYVEGGPALHPPLGAPTHGRSATILRDDATVVEIEALLEVRGMLVLADSFYPGWRATADGEPVEIRPVNHLFRGVVLAKGRHRVRFEYEPTSLKLGFAISAIAAAAVVLLVLRRRQIPS